MKKSLVALLLLLGAVASSATLAFAALDDGISNPEGLKLINAQMAKELSSRAARLGTSAGNTDTTFVGFTPGAPGAGTTNVWSIYAGLGKDGFNRPYNGTPHKGVWDFETAVNGDSLQGWWPIRNIYATTGGLTLSDRNRPWWAQDIGNDASYRHNGASTRTFGVIGVWHRDGGDNVAGVLSPLWHPPSGANAAWMGLRADGDNSYTDPLTGNGFNERVLQFTGFNAAATSGNDAGFPGYGSQMDQMLYRDIDFQGKPTANLTVRFKFQTVMATGFGTSALTRTGWFDCCPLGVTGGGGALPANQRNNFISSTDAGDPLAPRDSFMVYIGTGVQSADMWADPTGALNSVYDPQRRWFGEVLKWDRDGVNPVNPQPRFYKELLSVAGNWPVQKNVTADGFVDTTFTIPNSALALLSSNSKIRLVFRVKTNRGFDDQGAAYTSGRKGAAVIDRVSYTLTGNPEVVFGDFENVSDINNATNVSALDAWKATGRPPAIYDHPRLFSDLVYEDLCGQKGDISRVCNMSGVVVSQGDFDNSEAAGGLVDGTVERERANGIMSPAISFKDDDGNANTKNIHGLYGIGGNGGVGDVDATDDYYLAYDIYAGIMDPFTKGNLWRFGIQAYPSNAKAGYNPAKTGAGYPAWGQMRFAPFIIFNPDKQCLPDIEGYIQNGMLRSSSPTGVPDSLRVFVGKTQQCFRFGVSTGCSPTDGCYFDNVTLALVDGVPAQLGVQIWDWINDAFPANSNASLPGTAALFDTTSAHIKTGFNNSQTTNNTLRFCVPGDSVVISSSPTTARVDMVFRILPGPGNYQPVGRPDIGTIRRVPSSPVIVTKGDGSFWDEYRQVPGPFASPNAVALHHNGKGGWDPNVWNSARCDTAEVVIAALQARGVLGGPGANTNWMATYHESDFHFNSLGITKNMCYVACLACNVNDIRCDGLQPTDYVIPATTTKEATKIIPDGLLTPGSHVEYFFRDQKDSETPGAPSGFIPDTNVVFPQVAEGSTDAHRWQEFSVLPDRWKDGLYRHPVYQTFGPGPACLLVIDQNDRRGNERAWVSVADTIGATSQRKWGAHNGWHAIGGAGDLDLQADNRRGSDGLPGFIPEHGGSPGTTWDMYQVKASESLNTGAASIGSRLAFTGGSALVADKTSRTGPTQKMLETYYSLILHLTGDLNSGILGPFSNKSQNDVGLIQLWLQSGSTTLATQNRGYWAMGDGYVESSWNTAPTSIQNNLLSAYLGVGLVDPNYTFFSGNTEDVPTLKSLPEWQGKPSKSSYFFGVRNICLWTNDVLAPDGIGLTLGTVAGNYQRSTNGTASAGASVYKGFDITSPWKSLVDGWDIEHLTSPFDVKTVGRSLYMAKIFNNVWSKIWTVTGSPIIPLDVPSFDDGSVLNFVGNWANNPMASGTASIQLGLAKASRVEVKIFDVSGRLVRTLADRSFDAGNHTLVWDGTDNAGRPVARGVYFSKVRGPADNQSKITVLR